MAFIEIPRNSSDNILWLAIANGKSCKCQICEKDFDTTSKRFNRRLREHMHAHAQEQNIQDLSEEGIMKLIVDYFQRMNHRITPQELLQLTTERAANLAGKHQKMAANIKASREEVDENGVSRGLANSRLTCGWCPPGSKQWLGYENLGKHLAFSLKSCYWERFGDKQFKSGSHTNSSSFSKTHKIKDESGLYVCPFDGCDRNWTRHQPFSKHLREAHRAPMKDKTEDEAIEAIKEYFLQYHSFSVSDHKVKEWIEKECQ